MPQVIAQLIPVFTIFGIGVLCYWRGLLTSDRRDFLLKLIFYVTVPALILDRVSHAELAVAVIKLPIAIWLITIATMLVAVCVSRFVTDDRRRQGVLIIGSMILNSGFVLPFVLATQNTDGVARFQLMDLGNSIIVQSLVYGLAVYFGQAKPDIRAAIRRLCISPPLWAMAIALAFLSLRLSLPSAMQLPAAQLGNLTGPLILLALGASVRWRIVRSRLILVGVSMSLLCGIIFSRLIASIMGLTGADRELVLLVGVAPVGYNTLLFSSLAGLDEELAAGIVSWSIIVSMVTIPVTLFIT